MTCLLNNFSTGWLELISDLRQDCSCWQVPPLIHHLSKYIKPDEQRQPHLRQQLLPSCLCTTARGKAAPARHVPDIEAGGSHAEWEVTPKPQGAVQGAQFPHSPQDGESIAAMALQPPQTPFRCLYHTHSLQPKRSAEPHLTGTRREANSCLPKSQNFILPRKFYKYTSPTNHASREKPQTARLC